MWVRLEVLSGTGGDQLHVMVADVINSFDTVDRSILDSALGRLGLSDGFLLGKAKKEDIPCRFCVKRMVMVTCSGTVPFLPFQVVFGKFSCSFLESAVGC